MAKLQTKSNNINPFGGLFPIFKTLDKSGVRNVIDRTLDPRGTLLAFSHGDLRRLKRFSLPSFANCGVFAKGGILCWVAEHYISVSDNKVQYQL